MKRPTRSLFAAVMTVAVLLCIVSTASAVGKPATNLEKQIEELQAQVAALATVVSDLQSELEAAEARIAALEESPACELSQFFSVTDETINGEPGPNLIYDGPTIWQPVPAPPGLVLYTALIDSTAPPAMTLTGGWYGLYDVDVDDGSTEKTPVVIVDYDAPAGTRLPDFCVYRAESPDGPWERHWPIDCVDNWLYQGLEDPSHWWDPDVESGHTYYYWAAAADKGNVDTDRWESIPYLLYPQYSYWDANVSAPSNVVSVTVP